MKVQKNKKIDFYYISGVLILALGVYIYFALNVTFPVIHPKYDNSLKVLNTGSAKFAWPAHANAAISFNNLGIYQTHGSTAPEAMASTAKLVTALTVLQKYPLKLNQQGPTLTISPSDVAIYNFYRTNQGSFVPVVAGEKLTEYQMLEAMLLPSANNIADSLAIWAYGSLNNYHIAANNFALKYNLKNTHLAGDASGYSPSSVTSPEDLIRLGQLALKNPVLAQIVDLKNVSNFPVIGTLKNVDLLLGKDNIVGIKTGNNNVDNGIFLSASNIEVNKQPLTIYTSIMGETSLWNALSDSQNLIQSVQSSFNKPLAENSFNKGVVQGNYYLNWNNQRVEAVMQKSLDFKLLDGTTTTYIVSLNPISLKSTKNEVVGSLIMKNSLLNQTQKINLVLGSTPQKPPLWWLLLHPQLVL